MTHYVSKFLFWTQDITIEDFLSGKFVLECHIYSHELVVEIFNRYLIANVNYTFQVTWGQILFLSLYHLAGVTWTCQAGKLSKEILI